MQYQGNGINERSELTKHRRWLNGVMTGTLPEERAVRIFFGGGEAGVLVVGSTDPYVMTAAHELATLYSILRDWGVFVI